MTSTEDAELVAKIVRELLGAASPSQVRAIASGELVIGLLRPNSALRELQTIGFMASCRRLEKLKLPELKVYLQGPQPVAASLEPTQGGVAAVRNQVCEIAFGRALEKPVTSKPKGSPNTRGTSAAASAIDLEKIARDLGQITSNPQGHMILEQIPRSRKAPFEQIAEMIRVEIKKGDSIDKIKQKVVQSIVDRRAHVAVQRLGRGESGSP